MKFRVSNRHVRVIIDIFHIFRYSKKNTAILKKEELFEIRKS